MTLRTILLTSFSAAAMTLTACASAPYTTAPMPEVGDISVFKEHPFTTSAYDFATTEARLRSALEARGLTLFTVVDHGEGARSVDMEMGESKLFIFGNPKAGTPLMMADPQMGLDLPMKILIHQSKDGIVHVGYKDIRVSAISHDLIGQDERLNKIADTMVNIVIETAE